MESPVPRLLVWVPRRTPRLLYTLDWVLGQRLGIPYECREQAPNEADGEALGVLCYGNPEFLQGLGADAGPTATLVAAELLFEEGIRPLALSKEVGSGLFPTEHALGHDPLAGIFWMLSRYEEYQNPARDAYGRFQASQSLLYQAGVLEEAPADAYIEELWTWLETQFPKIQRLQPTLTIQPGVDVDLCYSYLGKPILRQAGGMLRELIRGQWRDLLDRWMVLSRQKPDPYDTYARLESWHAEIARAAQGEVGGNPALLIRARPPLFMLLTGSYDRLDPAHHPSSPYLRRLARYLRLGGAQLGWHPSLRSNRNDKAARLEIQAWSALAGGDEALDTRQHYLSLEVTRQPARLVAWGVRRDYSMGYAEAIGFRAGTAHSFGWYDLNTESPLPLQMHPVALMDVTLNHYMGLELDTAPPRVAKVLESYRRYGGYFSLLWHNSSAGPGWEGWEKIFEHCYRILIPSLNSSIFEGPPRPRTASKFAERWTLRRLSDQERQAWDAALPVGASVVHRLAYLDERLGPGWKVLASPDGRWLWPTADRSGLKGWLDRRLRRLAQPLMIQKMALLPAPGADAGTDRGTGGGQSGPDPAGPEEYRSLLQEWDLRYRWVDMHWEIPAHEPTYAHGIPGPNWEFHRRANAVVTIAPNIELQRQAYHAHHRRYLRPSSGRLRRISWEEARSETAWRQGFFKMLQSKAGWGSSQTEEAMRLIQTMDSAGLASIWVWETDPAMGPQENRVRNAPALGAGAVLWHSGSTLVYQFGFDTEAGRKQRAALHLVDALLAWAGNQKGKDGGPLYRCMDMEGSESPGLMRFYRGFGAKVQPYARLIKKAWYRFPWW
ncbi:MAG: DUF7033 domain-containing protein [Bacteroidia bacterium]